MTIDRTDVVTIVVLSLICGIAALGLTIHAVLF